MVVQYGKECHRRQFLKKDRSIRPELFKKGIGVVPKHLRNPTHPQESPQRGAAVRQAVHAAERDLGGLTVLPPRCPRGRRQWDPRKNGLAVQELRNWGLTQFGTENHLRSAKPGTSTILLKPSRGLQNGRHAIPKKNLATTPSSRLVACVPSVPKVAAGRSRAGSSLQQEQQLAGFFFTHIFGGQCTGPSLRSRPRRSNSAERSQGTTSPGRQDRWNG